MGYVHDTRMVAGVAIPLVTFQGGSWSDVVQTGNIWCKRRTAGDSAFTVKIPLGLPQSGAPGKGAWLKAVEVFYKINAAELDSLSAALYLAVLPEDGVGFSPAVALAFSYDARHASAAGRVEVDEHSMRLALAAPQLLEAGALAHLELAGDGSALGTIEFYAAQVEYTLRL